MLLYLIRRQNLDILDIPIAEITRQYIDYIDLMSDMRLELAAEYLVMAAILAEIKSRLLLPRPPLSEGIEDDPRAELVRRLQEYERFKKVAEQIEVMPRLERDFALANAFVPDKTVTHLPPPVELREPAACAQGLSSNAPNSPVGTPSSAKPPVLYGNRMDDGAPRPGRWRIPPASNACSRRRKVAQEIVVTFLALLELPQGNI